MRPESVEIKITLSGEQAVAAPDALGLAGGATGGVTSAVAFCEEVTTGLAPCTPLLDLGVVLRVRAAAAGGDGDSTVKLRPCRWSQLGEDFFTNVERGGSQFKIEAGWADERRTLAASMTTRWSDDRLTAVRAGALPVAGLFDDAQRRFLERCARERVNLSALTPLVGVTATRWSAVRVDAGGVRLSVRAERWVLDGVPGLLELSVVSSVDSAAKDQAALDRFVADRSLVADTSCESKTRRVLAQLVDRAMR